MSADEKPTVVRLDDTDQRWTESVRALPRTQVFGLRRFPSVTEYRAWVESVAQHPAAPPRTRLCAIAQRDWHVQGQTGCMFARLAALSAATLRWDYLVIPDAADLDVAWLLDRLNEAVADDSCQVLSVLLPSVVSPAQVSSLIVALAESSHFWLERDFVRDGMRHLHLRYQVAHGVAAWVMAFGPFDFVPNTRRGPFFELAIRVKPKPAHLFHRLNHDRGVAHLADIPLEMREELWEPRWSSSQQRTRMILGHVPDTISAAKATFTHPADMGGLG